MTVVCVPAPVPSLEKYKQSVWLISASTKADSYLILPASE